MDANKLKKMMESEWNKRLVSATHRASWYTVTGNRRAVDVAGHLFSRKGSLVTYFPLHAHDPSSDPSSPRD